jgi:UDP-N-acetylglucosamine 2-epimerase (non-hydrolysing)
MHRPFPEEANRRIASITTDLHFAPTEIARQNLIREGLPAGDIYVTGNTVVDALTGVPPRDEFAEPLLERVDWTRRVLLVTVHRRENLGDQLRGLCRAFRRILASHGDTEIVFPVHMNPRVRDVVFSALQEVPRVHLLEPIGYPDLIEVMRRSHLILSDSGGIQEEAPSFRKPVLILRSVTERPEVVQAGFGQLVGTDPDRVCAATDRLLTDPAAYKHMISGANPFGDGHAAARIVEILVERFALNVPLEAVAGA